MGQAGNLTVLMSAVSLPAAAAVISSPYAIAGMDFLALTVQLTIGSFTSIGIQADVLSPSGSWRQLNDSAGVTWLLLISSDWTGTVQMGARSSSTTQRVSQLTLPTTAVRFQVTPTGSATTPGAITLQVAGFNRPAGAYQSR